MSPSRSSVVLKRFVTVVAVVSLGHAVRGVVLPTPTQLVGVVLLLHIGSVSRLRVVSRSLPPLSAHCVWSCTI